MVARHRMEKSASKNFRGDVQCFPGKSAKDPVTFKTLEPQGCDSLWQNYVKLEYNLLDYTTGLGAEAFCRLPSPQYVGASTDQLPLVPRFSRSLAGLNHSSFKQSDNDLKINESLGQLFNEAARDPAIIFRHNSGCFVQPGVLCICTFARTSGRLRYMISYMIS